MKSFAQRLALPALTVLATVFLLNQLFTGSSNYRVVTISDIAKESMYKINAGNSDGSVDIVFNLPNTSALAQKLKLQMAINSSKSNVQRAGNENLKKQKAETKTQYPVTLSSAYLINNPDICSKHKKLHYIVIVHTSTDHFTRRRLIRQTWANKNLLKTNGSRIVFLCGLTTNKATQAMIENESSVYGDIIQGNFKDSYHNLTHKGVLAYRWVAEHCLNVDMVLKVDDDMFVNIFNLIEYQLPIYRNSSRLISCHVRPKGTSPIARKGSKWTVKGDQFKDMTHYPVTYCNGYFVLMTPDIIKELYRASFWTPFFWVDDVYLYGLLPFKAGKITHLNIAKNLSLNQQNGLKCFKRNSTCSLLASYALQDGYMEDMWFAAIKMFKSLAHKYLVADLFS